MRLNREVFVQDPLQTSIPNDGVAKVTEPQTPQEWEVLRYELASFVCEGEYRNGLERILATFLRYLGEPTQPAVWVSGFYGSGKSHLVRVLEFLWRDVEFPDRARARGIPKLPSELEAHLQELTIAGRREGGLWSAAGTLGAGAGDSVRLALLGILFRSARLPDPYPAARFVLWLKENGFDEAVRSGVEAAGREFETELRAMYVSPVLARSLLDAYPGFAESEAAVHHLLRTQYPPVSDISDEEMVATMQEVLALQSSVSGRIPLTLIVLDELQQYIGDNSDRMGRVQTVVEACSSRFASRLLFVATGQSALLASPQLSKVKDRFTVLVSLSDRDVETVVREVVLRKLPDQEPEVRRVLEQCSGEIDRHLVGTKIEPTPADQPVMAADYPLLPVRRRFWERVLRAVDRAGAAGQLRTQLRVVHEAVREVAEKPLGTVAAADRLFTQIEPTLLQTGVLLREVDDIIRRQEDGTEEGALRSRLCTTIFLISQLPTDPGADAGVRATVETLADLLVEDLKAGSASLRQRIPQLLAGMVERGELILVGQEYRLQTRESAAWEQDYRGRYARILADDARLAGDRVAELKNACTKALKDVAIPQGKSKTPRKIELCFTQEEPAADTGTVPVWIRDEWSVSEKTVREDAQAGGPDSPVIYVFLPRRHPDDLKKALAGHAAATETLQTHTTQPTREAQEARQGMETRQKEQRTHLDLFIQNILKEAKVFQGGGNEVPEGDLRASVLEAMKASLARLYPEFDAGDDPKWDQVKQRVRQGSGNALAALRYPGDPEKHPVCREVLSFIGPAGKKGLEVRRRFAGSPYGWPQDTADGALLVLVASGHLRALQNGVMVSLQQIEQSKMGQTEFRAEGATVSAIHRIAIRKLLQDAGIDFKPNEEAIALPHYVERMIALAQDSGGEPPMPLPPDTGHLEALKPLGGNDLILAVYEQRDRLAREHSAWLAARQEKETRMPRWRTLQRLLRHAQSLPACGEVAPQAEAIQANRSLLSSPDPVPPLCQRLTDELRQAIREARQQHLDAYLERIEALESDPVWSRLSETERQAIRALHRLGPLPEIRLGTEKEVLAALDETPLSEWENKTAAIAERISRALLEAARRLEPEAVRVNMPARTLKTAEEVEAYLQEVRRAIMEHIEGGRPVVL